MIIVIKGIEKDTDKLNKTELAQVMAEMKRENDELRAQRAQGPSLSFKVSEKGAVSIYGLGRFPVTLYATQFDKLAANWASVVEFVKVNRHLLRTKTTATESSAVETQVS